MSYNICVLIKQVPDQTGKAGMNPDGTIDRAAAKKMLNPFDRYALEAALHVKRNYGATVTAISMGPPPALEILLYAIEHGADKGVLLSDRRLAASDTLATAYALHKVILSLGKIDMIFAGLQTTDGDTAQVGPQIAERLDLGQVTYCEDFKIENGQLEARRVIEGGWQKVKTSLPVMVTVANSYHELKYKTIRGAKLSLDMQRNEEMKNAAIKVVTLDDVSADPEQCGIKGSPTIVSKTEKLGEKGGSCVMHSGKPAHELLHDVLAQTKIREYLV